MKRGLLPLLLLASLQVIFANKFRCLENDLTPSSMECNKYYTCMHGKKVLQECPDYLHFNPILKKCDSATKAGCELDSSEEENDYFNFELKKYKNKEKKISSEDSNSSEISDSIERTSSNILEDISTTDEDTNNKPNGKCRANNPGEVEFLPHLDCGKYYVCEGDRLIEMSCPPGLHFNPVLNVCDYPENANCQGSPTSTDLPSSSESSVSTERPSENSTEGENSTTNGPNMKCKTNNPGEVEFTPHENCEKYYVCIEDNLIEMSCPEGLHFNKELNICDEPENANCDDSGSTEPPKPTQLPTEVPTEETTEAPITEPTTAPTEEPSKAPTELTTTESSNINTSEAPGNSQGTTENVIVPNPSGKCKANNPGEVEFAPHLDCSKYYVCEGDRLIEMNCPPGLHFNPVLNVCDYPENANCQGSPSSTELPTSSQSSVSTERPSENSTEGESTTTDQPNMKCKTNNPGEVEFTPHENCEKYYVCIDDNLIEMSCPEGLHFNKELNICDEPENANCDDSGSTEPTEVPTEETSKAPITEPTNAPTEEPSKAPTELTTTESSNTNTSEAPGNSQGTTENEIVPNPSGKCRANNPGEVEFAPHLDCGKYYVCEGDRLIEMSCPPGLHFNPVLNVCDYPENANCQGSPSSTELPTSSQSSVTTERPSENSTEEESTTTDGPNMKCKSNNPGEVEFTPHENCEKYYVCIDDNLIEMSCPEGLHFNKELNICDEPENANCDDSGSTKPTKPTQLPTEVPTEETSKAPITEPTNAPTEEPSKAPTELTTTESSNTNTSEAPGNSQGTTENEVVPNPSGKCRANNPGEVEFAPHLDCGKYYVCEGDRLIEMSCPPGLHFNPVLNVCDYPENANCQGSPSSTELPTSSQSSVSTERPSENSTEGESTTTDQPNMKCKTNNPGEVEFTPHENCEKYYVCIDDNLIEMSCPEGLHFNKELNICDKPENANCDASGSTNPPKPTQLPSEVPTEETTEAPITEGTNASTDEPSSAPTELTTSESSNTNSSEAPGNSQGTTENEVVPNPSGKCRANNPGEVEFAPHLDCGKYYVCESDRLIEMSCPPGLHFNPVLNVCDYPEDANCQGSPSSTELPSSSESSVSTERPSANSTEGESTTTDGPNMKCKTNNPGEVEFTPHDNCEKYYVCIEDNLIEMSCPDGLHFNKELNVCDEPENANCDAFGSTKPSKPTQSPTEVPTEETTIAPITEPTNTPTEEPSNAPTEITTTESSNTNSSEAPGNSQGTTENEVVPNPSGKCRANNPGEVQFAPHPICGKYFICDNDRLIEMNCPEGLHFNPQLNVCDYPANAKCQESQNNSTQAPSTGDGSETTESEVTNKPQSGKCRANNPGEVEFASHHDCSKYYVCDHGEKIEMDCPAGLHFNSILNVCDYIENAKCFNMLP